MKNFIQLITSEAEMKEKIPDKHLWKQWLKIILETD